MDSKKYPRFLFLVRILSKLRPIALAYHFVALLGQVYSPRRNELTIVRERLEQCLPSQPQVVEEGCKSYLRNISVNTLNTYLYSTMTPKWIGRRIKVVNEECLKAAVESGKGVLILTAHQHHLVLLGVTLGLMGYCIHPILMDPEKTVPPFLKEYVDQMIGASEAHYHGGKYLLIDFNRSYVRRLYRLFESGQIVVSANDFPRDLAPKRRVSEPFLGKMISCPYGSLEVALSRNAVVITAFIHWLENDQFELRIDSLDTSGGVAMTMAQYVRQLEKSVSRNPGGWEGWKWGELFQ